MEKGGEYANHQGCGATLDRVLSVGTVSRYLNGAVLKEQNQRKIDAAVARLGYRRNALARSMKTGRSMLVGVIVPALSNMFSMRVIEGVEHALEAHGFSVLVADSGGDAAREREKVALLRERMADGLVLMPCGENARAILRAAGKMPVALIDGKWMNGALTACSLKTRRARTEWCARPLRAALAGWA